MPDLKNARGFLVFADGEVDEIEDGETIGGWHDRGLYATLLFAGFPLTRSDTKTFEGCIDITTDGQRVLVYGDGPEPYDMGAAAELFLDWYRGPAA